MRDPVLRHLVTSRIGIDLRANVTTQKIPADVIIM